MAENKPEAKDLLVSGVETLAELQERIYAQDQWALLALFQAMDAAGKDSTIKHVMSGLTPRVARSTASNTPSQELDHNYLGDASGVP